MKRYSVDCYSDQISESVDGEWIRYADHCEAMKRMAGEGAEPIAWMTHHDEPMIFPTRSEAEQHCDDGEQPISLYAAPAPGASPAALTGEGVMQMLSESLSCIGNLPDGPTDHARHRAIKARIRAFLDAAASQRATPIPETQKGIAGENTGFEHHLATLAASPVDQGEDAR